MLPKGEWPKWCKVCGGNKLGYCNCCLRTGEYHDIMGFHLRMMKPAQRLSNRMPQDRTASNVDTATNGS